MSSLQWVKVDKEHHPIVRVSTNNFGSNKNIQAIPPASNKPHTEDQIKKDKNGKERGKSKKKELPTHKKLPTNRTPSEVIPKMPKAGFPNKDFPSKTNPVVLFRTTSKRWPVTFEKTTRPTTSKTLTTMKSQEFVKLTMDNLATTMPPQPQLKVPDYAR